MKMKKIMTIFVSALLLLGLSACGKAATLNVDELSADVLKNVSFEVELKKINSDVILGNYGLPEGVTGDIWRGSSTAPDQLAVFLAPDENTAAKTVDALKENIKELKTTYSGYAPEEVPKLDKSVIEKHGKYVILCITNDSDNAQKVIKSHLK